MASFSARILLFGGHREASVNAVVNQPLKSMPSCRCMSITTCIVICCKECTPRMADPEGSVSYTGFA
jgi:hypothetical protein